MKEGNRVLFIAKTNLNNDGRILNQIKILQNHYGSNLIIDFILFPDKPIAVNLGENVVVHEVHTSFRNSSLLRPFTVIQFIWKTLRLLFQLNPKVIHVQDSAVVLPIFIYSILKKDSFQLVYDDHEMPNENESFQYRLIQFFEKVIMRKSNLVVFANKERMDLLREEYNLNNKLSYFLNLPYFDDLNIEIKEDQYFSILEKINQEKETGVKFIIHQGLLEIERGREKLAAFSKILPSDVRVLMLGISKQEFDDFLEEFDLSNKNFYFVGSVPYNLLNYFWEIGSGAIVMYLPTYINNRLCAPNRFYIAIKNHLPVLVNEGNPVLNNFVKEYKSGFFIENMKTAEDIYQFLQYEYSVHLMDQLIQEEIEKFIVSYESLMDKVPKSNH